MVILIQILIDFFKSFSVHFFNSNLSVRAALQIYHNFERYLDISVRHLLSIQARYVYRIVVSIPVSLEVAASKLLMIYIIGWNCCKLIIKVRSVKKKKKKKKKKMILSFWIFLSHIFIAKSTLHSCINAAIYLYIFQSFLRLSSITITIYLRTSDLSLYS